MSAPLLIKHDFFYFRFCHTSVPSLIAAEKQYILKTRLSKLNETKSRKSLDSLAKLQAKYTELRTLHEKRKVNLVLAQKTLKDFRCRLIFDLTQYIFPVLELTADGQSSLFL